MAAHPSGVTVYVPLIRESSGEAHDALFQVRFRATRGSCRAERRRKNQQPEVQDKNLAPLFDYGGYDAGVEAKEAYLTLMRHWRQQSAIPKWLLATPRAWQMEIVSNINTTSLVKGYNKSSHLALLLGMLASQGHLPVSDIYATGMLDRTGALPRVRAIAGLSAKLDKILDHIAKTQPQHGVLTALPRQPIPGESVGSDRDSEVRFARRLEAFRQANSHIALTVIYCDDLAADLAAHFPQSSSYRHWNRQLFAGLALATLFGVAAWQYAQPLYLNWSETPQTLASEPQRLQRLPDGRLQARPPCPESTPGEPVFALDDRMEMRVYVNDSAWAGALFPPQLALVMVGERSDIRVENLERTPGKPYYGLTYRLEAPTERYLVMAIAQRARSIDKGALNQALVQHLAGLQGVARISTAAGYLEKRYDSVQYRFRLASRCQDE